MFSLKNYKYLRTSMNFVKVLIGLLVFVAVAFGLIIALNMSGFPISSMLFPEDPVVPVVNNVKTPPRNTTSTNTTPINNTPNPSGQNPNGSTPAHALTALPNFTAEQRKLLVSPGSSATPAEQNAYMEMVKKSAQPASNITLGLNCVSNPVVIKIGTGTPLVMQNSDSKEHAVSFGDKVHDLIIPAGASKTVDPAVFKGVGIYGYGCDSFGPDGMIVIGG